MKRMLTRTRVLLLAGLFALAACSTASRNELWIVPSGYVGWLRLDYGRHAQPALPIELGRYVVRMPPEGRLQTSSTNTARMDDIEFAAEGSGGQQSLEHFTKGLSPRYGVQNAYAVGHAPIRQKPVMQFECVFVGTLADFKTNRRNCDDWKPGQLQPPKFEKLFRH